MTARSPRSLFLSHGSPLSCFEESPARDFLLSLSKSLPRPKAVLAVSAHWTTRAPAVGAAPAPETIYDFYGFPDFLYKMTYPAPGDSALAHKAADLMGADLDPERGIDHGIWTVMSLLWPQADIPVVPIAVQPRQDPRHHYRLGQSLKPLLDDGALILATGCATHNLRAYMSGAGRSGPQDWVSDFTGWLAEKGAEGDVEALLDYRAQAPYARENHPTDEHLLPFFTALGASADNKATRLHASVEYGVIAMDNYAFA